MSNDDTSAVAYHEAGHAALRVYFHNDRACFWALPKDSPLRLPPLVSISIEADEEARGRTSVIDVEPDAIEALDGAQRQAWFEQEAMTAMAGVIAQRRFAPEQTDEAHDGSADDAVVEKCLDELDAPTEGIRDAYRRVLKLRAEALVAKLWPRIERIASALLEKKTLTGDEVDEAFRSPST